MATTEYNNTKSYNHSKKHNSILGIPTPPASAVSVQSSPFPIQGTLSHLPQPLTLQDLPKKQEPQVPRGQQQNQIHPQLILRQHQQQKAEQLRLQEPQARAQAEQLRIQQQQLQMIHSQQSTTNDQQVSYLLQNFYELIIK